MDVQTILSSIQKNLKAPKSQRNTFGNYNYRNAEDILEAVKPLLEGSILTITDEIVLIGTRYYIKATATIKAGKDEILAVAFAREPEIQKGMNESQITGSASSYARKYALNGLFCIDDTKDADSQDNREETKPVKPNKLDEAVGCEHKRTMEFVAKSGTHVGKTFEKCLDCSKVIRLVEH